MVILMTSRLVAGRNTRHVDDIGQRSRSLDLGLRDHSELVVLWSEGEKKEANRDTCHQTGQNLHSAVSQRRMRRANGGRRYGWLDAQIRT